MNNIDLILYEKGDIVIRKNKTEDISGNIPKEEVIVDTKIIETDSYYYQLLYFESNPDSGHVALEYEPFDEESRTEYYKLIRSMKGSKSKTKQKPKKETEDNTVVTNKNVKYTSNSLFYDKR